MDRPRERARRGRSVADQAWLPCIEGLLQSRLLAASKIRVLVDLLGTDHSAPVDLSPPLRGGEVTNLGYDALRVHPCPDQSPALGSVRGCSHHPDPPLSGSESSGSSPSAAKMRARPLSLGLCPGSGASKWESHGSLWLFSASVEPPGPPGGPAGGFTSGTIQSLFSTAPACTALGA